MTNDQTTHRDGALDEILPGRCAVSKLARRRCSVAACAVHRLERGRGDDEVGFISQGAVRDACRKGGGNLPANRLSKQTQTRRINVMSNNEMNEQVEVERKIFEACQEASS
jgi:hypothetical protein